MKIIHYYNKIFFNNYDLTNILAVPTQYKIEADRNVVQKKNKATNVYLMTLQIAPLLYEL